MKKLNIFKITVIVTIALLINSTCKKDESFTQVSAFERGIHNAINDHRVSLGKPQMVLQFLLIDDAQLYSIKMANESVAFGTEGVAKDLQTQKTLLAADSSGVWVAYCEYENVDSVMYIVLKNPESKALIEGYFNQSAVGTAKDVNGNFYITNLLLHFP